MARILAALILAALFSVSHAQMWESTNGPGGAECFHAAVGPDGAIYVLSRSIYRSSDHGQTWKRVGPGLIVKAVWAQKARLAWTSSGAMFVAMPLQLIRSTDQGATWQNVRSLGEVVDMQASTTGHLYVVSDDTVLVSSNDGVTWTTSAPSPLYAGAPILVGDNGVVFTVDKGNRFLRSADNGVTWAAVTNGIATGYPYDLKSTSDGRLLLGFENKLYQSSDAGISWSVLYQADYMVQKVISRGEDTIYLMAPQAMIRSIDAGKTWSQDTAFFSIPHTMVADASHIYMLTAWDVLRVDLGLEQYTTLSLPNGRIQDLMAAPDTIYARAVRGNNSIFEINDLWGLTNNGGWGQKLAHLTDHPIWSMGIDSSSALHARIGQGFITFAPAKDSWTYSQANFKSAISDLAFSRDYFFATNPEFGILRSSDKGATWEERFVGLPLDVLLTSIATTTEVVYTGGGQFFGRSTDRGFTWEEVAFPIILGSGMVRAIECKGPVVIVGIDRTGVYFSSDYGSTWENHSQGLGVDTIYQLLSTPDETLLAATSSGVMEFSPTTKIWKNINDDLLAGPVFTLALAPDGKVYAGTNGDGVWRTTKSYGSWTRDVIELRVAEQGVSIYPNPAATEIMIRFTSEIPRQFHLAAYNIRGEVVSIRTSRAGNELCIDISSLIPGQYFLRMFSDGKIRTLPFTIHR